MKKIIWFLFISALSFSLYPVSGTCYGGLCFDCYDSSQNLPQNQIVAFSGNSEGYMFVAGRNFLARFDGSEFILPEGGRPRSIPTSTINDFVMDGSGTFYIATDLGLWISDSAPFTAKSFRKAENVGNFYVKSLAYNMKNALVYGAVTGKGVFVLSANGFFEWFSPANSRLGTKSVDKVFVDSLGTVWLGTENGVYFMKDGSDRFVQIDYLDVSVSAFAEMADGRLFAGGKEGLYIIENGEVSSPDTPFSNITALASDDSGTLWIGTESSGIYLLDDYGSLQVSRAENITAFSRDKEGHIWFGTSAGGFCIAKRSAFKGMEDIFADERVLGVVSDSSGNILVNTRKGIYRSNEGKWEFLDGEIYNKPVFERIFFDRTDNLWASGESGLYIMQPDKTFKPVKELYTSEDDLFPASSSEFFSDSKGNVWTNDRFMPGALFVFRNDRTVKRFLLPSDDAWIVDIVEHLGKIFVITKRDGVFELDDVDTLKSVSLWKKDIFVKRAFVDSKQRIWLVTLSDEIYINIEHDAIAFPVTGISGKAVINSVFEDKHGDFWLMTNSGVARIKGNDADCFISGNCVELPVVIFDKNDGMVLWECADEPVFDAALSDYGWLFVPMMKGIALFDTDFKEEDVFVPEIKVERIFSPDEDKNYDVEEFGQTPLPYTVNTISFSYSAPVFSGTGTLLYDYSFDKERVVGTTETTVSFSNIHSGLHEFSVRAYCSGDPSKFSEKKFTFNVKQVFYRKIGFMVTLPLLVLLIVSAIIFLNRRLKNIREAEIKRLIDEKTAELQMKNNSLKEAVMKDPLTGLMNRRYMFEVEERKIRRFIESRERKMHLMDNRNMLEKNDLVYGVIMMDIDHFKRVNDIYGHDAGDMVLKGVAQVMQDSVRADDILIRWGGEEFLVVLKNIPVKKIFEVAKKIRKAIEQHPFTMQSGSTIWVTVSMGVVFLPFFADNPKLLSFENIITLADIALYNSKENGRDMATFVVPGGNVPKKQEDVSSMLSSSEFAAVNGFYTFEKIEPDNFSEFEI